MDGFTDNYNICDLVFADIFFVRGIFIRCYQFAFYYGIIHFNKVLAGILIKIIIFVDIKRFRVAF